MNKNKILLSLCFASLVLEYTVSGDSAAEKCSKSLYSVSHFGPQTDDLELIAQNEPETAQTPYQQSQAQQGLKEAPAPLTIEGPVINFNNVSITEFLRFVSRLTGKNFVFDPQELQFPVTIMSESPASLEDVMAALLQNLRIHGFLLIEEGNNFVIHRNQAMKAPAELLRVTEGGISTQQIATQVFQVANVPLDRMAAIVKAMTSADAIVEVVTETSRIVVTDILPNLNRLQDIIKKLDAPHTNLEIGQYVAINNSPAALLAISQRILEPLASGQPLIAVPYPPANSVFVVSTPFLVEKALSILQSLDTSQATSGILNIDQMKFDVTLAKKLQEERQLAEQKQKTTAVPLSTDEIEQLTREQRTAILREKGLHPEEISKLTPQQLVRILREKGLSQLEREKILGQKKGLFETELPLGQVEATQFFIHKLQYRNALDVTKALKAIADSLSGAAPVGGPPPGGLRIAQPSSDLVVTLLSVQPLEANNSLVFTGTRATLQKVKDLVAQVDVPVRQVLIEVLVLDTTLNEALTFGVEWGARIARKNFAGQAGLITNPSAIALPLQNVGFPPTVPTIPPTTLSPVPLEEGFSVTSIGRKIKFHGQGFIAGAAVVNALRADDNTKVIINPKIVTEHNVPAEIFVGEEVPIKGQSVVNATTNNLSNLVTTNFETQQVGVKLKVTPLISSSDTVTLIIEQEISTVDPTQVQIQGFQNTPPATIKQITMHTRVHVPSDYYLMLSGVLNTTNTEKIRQIPVLGSLPLIGFLFSNKLLQYDKRNVIMYLRPKIIDSPIDIERVTKSQQDAFDADTGAYEGWRSDLNDLMRFLNFQ